MSVRDEMKQRMKQTFNNIVRFSVLEVNNVSECIGWHVGKKHRSDGQRFQEYNTKNI
jgi:hypothetical protein